MENNPQETKTENTPPSSTPPPAASPSSPTQNNKKVPVWVWLLSGCLIISILSMLAIFFLGWLGFRKAKHEFNDKKPQFEQLQQDFEKAAKDAQEWEKKSEELRNSMPNPEDLNYPTIPEEETSVN